MTLSLSLSDFLQLRALPDDALRARFHLPPGCRPGLEAMTPPEPHPQRLTVIVECRGASPPSAHALPSAPPATERGAHPRD